METYTQDQVDAMKAQWEQELTPLKAQIEELSKYKPVEKSDAEKVLEERTAALWQKEVDLTLRESGLSNFAEFIHANDSEQLKTAVEKLKSLLSVYKVDNSFVPDSHKSADKYSQAEKNKDPLGMIGSKLSTLFK